MVTAGIADANLIEPVTAIGALNQDTVKTSLDNWKPNWDQELGGEKGTQKFMIPVNLEFLLDYAALSGDASAKAHVRTTLDRMALGGIYDHLGGGFYRYSTDAEWKVPHFEKMLYDNAQILSLYSKAYKIFKDEKYRAVVMETIAFLDREMKHPDGGYYAAMNADSEGEEGKFYVWKKEELESILGDDLELFASYYNITSESVWEEGKYILHRSEDDDVFISDNSMDRDALDSAKKNWRQKLMAARTQRVRPSTDDKIITSWNALLINGFVDVYATFGETAHLDKAKSIFGFLKAKSHRDGGLVHTYKEGSQQKEGFLEDYAFLADASLKLYSVTTDQQYLEFAQTLNREAKGRFYDDATGMYNYNDDSELIARIIKTDDGVLPSPNAVMAHNLYRLGHIEYDTEQTEKAKKMLSAMVPALTESPPSYSKWNSLLLHTAYPYYEIAVVGKNAKPLVRQLHQNHIPNTLVVGSVSESQLPLFEDRYFDDGTFIYVCKNTTCKLPVETVGKAMEQLRNF